MKRLNPDLEYTLRPFPEAPITVDGPLPQLYDLDAIVLRNAGTATVNLWQGAYTLAPGETISFNTTIKNTVLDFVDVSVKFDTATGSIQLLQIITIKSSPC